jgi:hypothetical protein
MVDVSGEAKVSLTVRNTGKRRGVEVVQPHWELVRGRRYGLISGYAITVRSPCAPTMNP